MKSFTEKLVLKFTARVRSKADLERRCEKIAARAENTIGCELGILSSWSNYRR